MKALQYLLVIVCLVSARQNTQKQKSHYSNDYQRYKTGKPVDFSRVNAPEAVNGANIQIWECNNAANQQWNFPPNDQQLITLKSTGQCLDIDNYGTSDGSNIHLWDCHTSDTDPNHQNQQWTYNSDTKNIIAKMSGKCIDVYNKGDDDGTNAQIWACGNPPQSNQQWVYNTTDSTIREVATGKCLDAGTSAPPACTDEPTKSMPFCNTSLPLAQRVADLISQLSVNEKIGLFGNGASGIARLGIAYYQWWSEALHGVAGSPGVSFDAPTTVATSFPQVIGTAASFDAPLFNQIGKTIATEARAFNNAGHSGLTFWAPNINIFRDPRWGRGQETPGEDPFLNAEYANQFVNGMQVGEDPNYIKISACCKHYAAYSLEDSDGVDRHHFDGNVTDQDWADTYLPAFQSCIQKAHGSIMCSYNANNGIPSCADHHLLTDDLRTSWGFNMYVTGDCGAVDDVQYTHDYTNNVEDTCHAVLSAGLNVDCGNFLQLHLTSALSSGKVTEADLDQRLTDLFSVQMRLGMFDPADSQPYRKIGPDVINTQANQNLALKAAQEGIVLLKNNKALPWSKNNIKSIAVVGPNADAASTMQGNYYGNAPFLITPRQGLASYATVNYQKGTDIASSNTGGFNDAINAAKNSDATVIVVGIDQSQESEGRDRTIVTLPGNQNDFISQVASGAKGPVVLVVMAGSSVDISAYVGSNDIDAIIWVGYPGQAGGQALAQIIFGEVNPSGRLPMTFHNGNFINEVSMLDMHMRPGSNNLGRTYRFYTGKPVYEFGTGLSYTTFTYQWSAFPDPISQRVIEDVIDYAGVFVERFTEPQSILATVTVKVSNTGNVSGDDAVLYFVVPSNAGQNGVPLKYLAGFQRVTLAAGASTTVTFNVAANALALPGVDGKLRTRAAPWTIQIGVGENKIQRDILVLSETQIHN